MIEPLNGFPPTVLAFACRGHVTKQDYETVLIPAVEQVLTRHNKVRVYYRIDPGFSGFEPGAMWDDFKVGMEYLFRWERIAVVTDVEWIRYAVHVFSFVLPCVTKVFRVDEAKTAREWIVEGMTP